MDIGHVIHELRQGGVGGWATDLPQRGIGPGALESGVAGARDVVQFSGVIQKGLIFSSVRI